MFWQWLRQQIANAEITPQQLAKLAGLERSHVYKLLSPHYQQHPRRATAVRIARALNVPISEALRAAGYVSPPHVACDTANLLAETAAVLREVPECYYAEAVRFLRNQLHVARDLFVGDGSTCDGRCR